MRVARLTFSRLLAAAAICIVAGGTLAAQQRATTTVSRGQPSVTTQVERAEVVYVAGNDIVVRMESGELKDLTVPSDATAVVDGKTITVKDLKPGMKLQRTITTTTTPTTVTTARTVSGRVVAITPPLSIVLAMPEGGNKQFRIPEGMVFTVDGEKKTAFEVRPGMTISANIVTTGQGTDVAQTRSVTGTAPAPAPRPTPPPPQPVLLIETPAPPPVAVAAAPAPPAPAPAKAPEPAPKELPKTASPLPLIGLLGLLMVAASLGLRALRN